MSKKMQPILLVSGQDDGAGEDTRTIVEENSSLSIFGAGLSIAAAAASGLSLGLLAPVAAGVLGLQYVGAKTEVTDGKEKNTQLVAGNIDKKMKELIARASGLMTCSLDELKEMPCVFPPGHPLPGRFYRLHPLAEFNGSHKKNVYIPAESYDEVLYAEREAELVRLLVTLGATRISIRKNTSANKKGSVAASAGAEKIGIGGSIDASIKIEHEKENSDERTFVLEGAEWGKGDSLDRSQFGWLPYEPSWEAMVLAREVGGCLNAAVELKEKSGFSVESSLSASANYGVISGMGKGDLNVDLNTEKGYFVEAEFAKLLK